MNQDLKLLPPPEKKIAAKVLAQQGHSPRELEHWLEISDSTIYRALRDQTPEELTQFEAEFKASIEAMKKRGLIQGYRRLVELLPKERRIDQIVKGLDKLEGHHDGSPNTVVNIAVAWSDGSKL